MKSRKPPAVITTTGPARLEDIPNIGKSIAADLRALGILTPQQLAARDPLKVYLSLSGPMGRRHDPCVFYTLLAAQRYLQDGAAVPWWKFTGQGKQILAALEASGAGSKLSGQPPANIASLPNFGPKSQQMLAQAGIHTVEQLRSLGAVRAYLKVKHSGANASLNLLWAMEGALTGQHWQVVAKQERLRLLLELEEASQEK